MSGYVLEYAHTGKLNIHIHIRFRSHAQINKSIPDRTSIIDLTLLPVATGGLSGIGEVWGFAVH